MNHYLAKLLNHAGVGPEAARVPVKVPGWGKEEGGPAEWHVAPLSGREENLIEAYINRTAQVKELTPEKIMTALRSTMEALEIEDDEKRNVRINQAAGLVIHAVSNSNVQDSARLSATIYYAARNKLGMQLFKPEGAETDLDDFEAIDQLGLMPLEMRRIAERAISEHIISPLQLATLRNEEKRLQDEVAKKSAATPAGESQPT